MQYMRIDESTWSSRILIQLTTAKKNFLRQTNNNAVIIAVKKATGPLPSNKIMGIVFNLINWCSICYENENKKQKKKVTYLMKINWEI